LLEHCSLVGSPSRPDFLPRTSIFATLSLAICMPTRIWTFTSGDGAQALPGRAIC